MPEPALRYLSLGAGVQSSTIVEMIADDLLPRVDFAIFADLEDEPAYVYTQLDYLATRLATRAIPLIRLHPGSIVATLLSATAYTSIPAFLELAGHQARVRRQCTNQFKAEPIERYVKDRLAQLGLTRPRQMKTMLAQVVKPGVTVACWLGISADEVHRLKPNRTPWIENVWPLIDLRMSRTSCITWLTEHNHPVPGKSNCRICPFHRTAGWRDMAQNRPADFAHAVNVETQLQAKIGRFAQGLTGALYLNYACQSLPALVHADLAPDQSLFDICEEGHCWT
ncbi:MAG: hypothetical protein NT169_25315 [Chloroflexi bacterium]|nr:hypothetical protein [Chloroflexota bacterium]